MPPLTQFRVLPIAPHAIRITHAPARAEFPPDRPWLKEVLLPQPALTLAETGLKVERDEQTGLAQIFDAKGALLLTERDARLNLPRRNRSITLDISATEIRAAFDKTTEAIYLAWNIKPGEGFYGWGEWFNAFRREQGQVQLKIRDAIALIQQRETYSAIPLFFSDRGYAVWLLNSYPSTWRIEPNKEKLEVEAFGPHADYIFIYGPTFRDILSTYTTLTGRPPLVPRWAFGLMVTGYPQEAQSVVEERAQEHRKRNIPLDAIILDYHWEERYHNFQWRKSVIPDPTGLIARLRAQGIRLGLIFTPFVNGRHRPNQRRILNTLAGNIPAGLEKDDERALPEYADAKAQGLFAHDDAKWWFGAGGMMDFANPTAAAWWNAKLKPLYEQGIAFFKNDDGEYLPRDSRSALGINGREYHNLYGFFYSRAIYDGMAALDDRRPFIYARSVWAGTQRYPAIFLGDQKPTGAHILSTLRAALNLGLLGFAYWTADVFGLDGKTTPEMHMRYAQYALLAPIARYFWRPPAVDNTRFPWSHNTLCETNFKRYTELRYRLLPYYYTTAWQTYRTGLPMLRPMLLDFDAKAFATVADQAMLGEALLIAPITEPGATARTVVVPGGTWHDFWGLETWETAALAQTIRYAAPMERLPLLVRGGSIVPFGPALQHIPDDHAFTALELHCWPPYPATLDFYEDDGLTRAYQTGAYTRTQVQVTGDAQQLKMHIGAAVGEWPLLPAGRAITAVFHRVPQRPERITWNGVEQAAWDYVAAEQRLHITQDCATREPQVVQVYMGI